MTDAQVSQVATEVLRTNLAVTADVSQLAVEVLISNLSNGAGSASGTASSSFVGDSAGIVQDRAVSTGGTATVSGIIQAIINADFSASGLATVSGDGLASRLAVASATGASSEAWIGEGAGLSIALAAGSSDALAVGAVAASFAAAGSSVAEAVSRFLHSASTQIGDGVSCDDNTQDATGNIGNTGVGITTQIPSTFACGTLTGGFTAGPSGSYTRQSTCPQNDCVFPTPDTPIVLTWKKTNMVARCCDISWSGDEIILGTYNGSQLVPGPQVVSTDGHVYVSRDRGATWAQQPVFSTRWVSVTMTANATLLGAYPWNESNHYISNNSGAGWSAVAHPWGTTGLVDAKASDSGSKYMAHAYPNNQIYMSNNNGASWSAVIPDALLSSPTFTIGDMSSDGAICYAGHYYSTGGLGLMYRSTNAGASWSKLDAYCAWNGISCSGDGTYVIGSGDTGVSNGLTWFSNNSGVSFRSIPVRGSATAMSTSGQVQAYVSSAVLYLSKDYGQTFSAVSEITNNPLDVAINKDGSVIVVCCQNDYVYIGTT